MCLLCITNKLPQTIYCERGYSNGLLSEPINAFTNLVFPLAGFLGHRLLKIKKITDKKLRVLPWLLTVVGLGSFIYHTARSSITVLFDAIPIFVFILFAIFLVLKELFQNKLKAFLILLGFVALELTLSIYVPREFMNGSIRHFAAIIFISIIGILVIRKYGSSVRKPYISIIVLYAAAIFFRSVDPIVCPFFPIGSHFLWHILSASAGYQAIVLLSTIKSL